MRSVPTTQEQLERVLKEENKEIYIMAKLSKAMEEVISPRCGAKLHYFRIEGHEYRGFGMERKLFQKAGTVFCFFFLNLEYFLTQRSWVS